ncbi:NUDIX hydrolase [Streptomyces profundus]|uniref:NUDIX hydrolase n=1 Tax=Streptomyces profundus TaxID=2867410 RepID=UPI001D16A587|nr:NUDIX domain-containing protein [Streptomyces sp. MA3_2.13]UED83635.1 NUDIX domain-containing protein [Streptomyces sp. MA3_2.13]
MTARPPAGPVTIDAGVRFPTPAAGEVWVAGAAILDGRGRVFAQRRSPERRLFPDTWDLVGGHVEPGETLLAALVREVAEETGWRVRRVTRFLGVETWVGDDGLGPRHEADFVVEVTGDLSRPRLEWSKHPTYDWFGPDRLHLLKENKRSADQLVYRVAARALGAPRPPDDATLLARIAADAALARLLGAACDFDIGRTAPGAAPTAIAGCAAGGTYHLVDGAVWYASPEGESTLLADTLGEALELMLGAPRWAERLGRPAPAPVGPDRLRAAQRALGIVPAPEEILLTRLADTVARTADQLPG